VRHAVDAGGRVRPVSTTWNAKLSAVEEELRKSPGAEFMPLRAIDGQLLITPPKTGA
jgi:hypothetical protein